MRDHPTLYLLTTVVAVATAIALLGTGLAMGNPRVADPRSAAIEQVVRDFYAALNMAIGTGDPTALDEVVAEDLVTHGSLASLASGRAGLIRYLATLHATNPQLELSVEEVVAARDQALVYLSVRGSNEASFLGSSLRDGSSPWGTVDVLAVSGHRVVEYWGGATGLALLEPLGQASFTIDAPAKRLVSLDRLTLPPGASFAARGAGEARLLFVEAGTVAVTSTPLTVPQPIDQPAQVESMVPAEGETPPQASPPLVAGDFFSLPTWSRSDVYNGGMNPASVLVLATGSVTTTAGWTSSGPVPLDTRKPDHAGTGLTGWQAGVAQISPSGAIVAPLTGNAITTPPGERTVVALGRVTLAPGSTLTAFQAAGPHLLVVNKGTVDLAAIGKPAWIYHGTGNDLPAATLGTATGALLHAGTAASLHNPGEEPAVVTIVVILPAGAALGATD